MKYLFFDIECSNCFGGNNKICEFGYVITDEKFNVITKGDIPISPGDRRNRSCRFDTSIYKREPGFEWAYEFDYYFDSPRFPHHYQFLKNLFENKDTLVFGYSVNNDIRYFDSEFKRYKLEPFNYKVCDVQIIMNFYSEKKEKFKGLQHAFKKLCGANEFISLVPHLSRDDAFMTMRVLQEMLKNLEVSVDEIIELCPGSLYDANEYLDSYYKRKDERVSLPSKSKLQVKWGDFYRSYLPLLEKEDSIGRICTISSLFKTNETLLNKVIEYIKENDLVAHDRISGSDIIIVVDEEDKERILSLLKYPFNGQFIILSEIKDLQIC